MQITKIHRVLKFRQSRWLQTYIEQNQQLRANAKNEFEKDFFKLMLNSVHRKTCENIKKRTDLKLVTSKVEAKTLTETRHCMGYRIFLEDLIGIQYLEQLPRPHENYTTTQRIGWKLHQLSS